MTGLSRVVGVIEDDASVRKALERVFGRAGYEVCLFATGEEYFADPRRADVDCLVIDVRLPGISGLELLEQIQAGNRTRAAAIVLTSHADDRVRERAIAAGAIGFFLKPFDNRQLQKAVAQALGLAGS
jgi:FixJ family two-component response regulator